MVNSIHRWYLHEGVSLQFLAFCVNQPNQWEHIFKIYHRYRLVSHCDFSQSHHLSFFQNNIQMKCLSFICFWDNENNHCVILIKQFKNMSGFETNWNDVMLSESNPHVSIFLAHAPIEIKTAVNKYKLHHYQKQIICNVSISNNGTVYRSRYVQNLYTQLFRRKE